jgi:hypothetical protein
LPFRGGNVPALVSRAATMKDEPVGRAILLLGSQTGCQANVSPCRVHLNVRFAPYAAARRARPAATPQPAAPASRPRRGRQGRNTARRRLWILSLRPGS